MELHFYLKQGNLHDSPQLVGFHIYLQFSLFFTLAGPDICSHADFTQLVTNPFQISHKSFSDPFFSCVTIGCRPKSDSFFLGPLPHIRNTPCRSICQHSNISKCQKNYLIRVSSKQMRVSRKAIFHHFHIACSFRFFSIRTIEWWTVFRGQTHYSPLQQFWRNRPKVNWQQLSNCFLGREKGLKRLFSTIIYGSALALWSGHHQKITI